MAQQAANPTPSPKRLIEGATPAKPTPATPAASPAGKTPDLQDKMRRKLQGARFRWINERLYTAPSKEAVAIFQREPELFDVVRSKTDSRKKSCAARLSDALARPICFAADSTTRALRSR